MSAKMLDALLSEIGVQGGMFARAVARNVPPDFGLSTFCWRPSGVR